MLIGTAGHIDHGKTSLVRALTGRNTDRLPEEIQRGISIELGYAYVPLAAAGAGAGERLGFIDVPGHEKFVHTMLAGATGIDLALLVVAADDGVMPQTEEHLDILRLLGVDAGAIALTKVDAVAPGRVSEVRAQLARWLAGSAAAAWPVFEVSSVSGAGIDGLRGWLHAQAARRPLPPAAGQFRMAVDRVFTLGGIGTIVAGTVHAGRVAVGDEVVIQPAGRRARVRSLHAQDQPAVEGRAGQRCALNLAGVAREAVERGDWVQAATLGNLAARFDAVLLPAAAAAGADGSRLRNDTTVHLHHGTRDVQARVAVLQEAGAGPLLVSLTPAVPLPLCAGDRIVLRDAQARRTLAGGRVLDTQVPARGRRRADRLLMLQTLAATLPADPVAALRARLAYAALAQAELASGWNLAADECGRLVAAGGGGGGAGGGVDGGAGAPRGAHAPAAGGAPPEREPEMPGLEQNRLRRMVAPALPQEAVSTLVDELLAAGRLLRRGAFVALPGHQAELARDERLRWEKLKPLLMEQRFEPPRVRDLARDTGLAETEVRSLLKRVARVGEVTLVAQDHFFMTDAVQAMADIAGELAATHGAARAAEFRDRIGTGRKLAILILEFFDRVGYTRRVRDDHVLRRDNPWRAPAAAHPAVGPG
ncbi:MAG: selenocysteine-specific translation elongation factor [Burkholderiaceae bacterium]